jgi:hypothetical protein
MCTTIRPTTDTGVDDVVNDSRHLDHLLDAECFADLADAHRISVDIKNEGHRPDDFDVAAIAIDMRQLAGNRPLDSVSDEHWTTALTWHRRSTWPTVRGMHTGFHEDGVAEVTK